MVRHIFTIIWNERKANGWILLEYILIFCVLWFCFDYLYFMGKSNTEPLGFDIDHTYEIRMGTKNKDMSDDNESDKYERVSVFSNRVLNYQGVEAVCFAKHGIPYSGSKTIRGIDFGPDSLNQKVRVREVTSGYFDVFKMKLTGGRLFNSDDPVDEKTVVLSPDRHGKFGEYPGATLDVKKLHTIDKNNDEKQVIGYVEKTKDAFFDPYESSVYLPLARSDYGLRQLQIVIRVTPQADREFADRFMRDMRDQLEIGPYYLSTVTSLKEVKKRYIQRVVDRMSNTFAITAFLFINIFLGLIGTFWYRVQTRKSEIGLRIAMGATRKNVRQTMLLETLALLFIASIIGVNICINIGQTDILQAIDMPVGDRIQAGTGLEQDFINFGITFIFLAVVSLLAVWYPAKQASDIPPAEALHEE